MIAHVLSALVHAVLETTTEWFPWPGRGQSLRDWWRAKSRVGKAWALFSWLVIAGLIALIGAAIASVAFKSSVGSG
jgi:hypothetical protein